MKKQINRFLAMLLTVVIAAGMLPATAFAAGEGYGNYAPTGVYVTPTSMTDDDSVYLTIQWTTENRIDNITNDENIRNSFLMFNFRAGTGTIADGGNKSAHWSKTSITGNKDSGYVLQLYFSPELLEDSGGQTTAHYTLRITPGIVLDSVSETHAHSKFFGGRVGFYGGKTVSDNAFIASGPVGNVGGYEGYQTKIEISSQYGNLLWSTNSAYKTMNEMKLAADSVKISANNSLLPKGQTVYIPINVSALTELGTDAAHAYTGAANSLYLINQDVYVKVANICYTGTDYGDSISFSESNGQLYMNVKESIYDKIKGKASIELPLKVTVTQTLTGAVTGSPTITLTRPTVARGVIKANLDLEWLSDGHYKIAQQAKLTAKEDYQLPDSIKVTVGGKSLTAGTDYTYDKTTGIVTIHASSVTDDISITASADKKPEPLGDINTALQNFPGDIWYNQDNSTLTTKPVWTVSASQNGTFSNTITLDGEGSSVTKTLYFKNGSILYSYELTYKRDVTAPVISGIENGKTYCTAVEATVSDDNLKSVTLNGAPVILADNKFTISPAADEQTIVATDEAGNKTEYTITVNNEHTLSYAATENVITETCEHCSSHKATATITATDAVYAGSPLETASVACSDGWKGGTLAISYVNNNGVGEATASITKNGVTASIKFNITAGSQTAPASIGKTDETIDGKADGSFTGVNNTMEYRKDGETSYKAINGNKVENLAPGTYYVRYKANANYNASPDSDVIVIKPGRKLVVNFIAGENTVETKELSWNGKIDILPQIPSKTGYDQTAPTWDKSLAELQNIKEDITVTAQYTINSYGITLPAKQTGYTLTADNTTVEHDGTITLTLILKPGYSATDSFSVSANGSKVTMNENNGVYTGTVTDVSGAQNVTVSGVADITAPDNLVVSYKTDSFKEFLNGITFGLFFKDTVTVTVSATDAGSGIKEFTYRLGDGEMQMVTATNGSATFTVSPEFKSNISEVTAVDNVGNKTAEKAYEYFAVEKTAPNAPSVDAGTYEEGNWTSESVTFTVSGSSSTSGIQKYQYSTDNGQSWQDMETTRKTEATGEAPANVTEAKLTVTGDADSVEYIFRAVSNAGNNGAKSDDVTLKIDTIAPTISVSGDIDTIKTSDTVDITAAAGISGSQITVSKDGGQPETISGTTYQVTENGTYIFRVTNGVGVTADASITYRMIDTKTPVISLDSGDYTDNIWTNKNIMLTVENSTDNLGTDTIEYRVDSGEWQRYLSPVTVSDDTDKDGAVYTFRITAENGFRSTEKTITVKRDSVAPGGDIIINKNSVETFINAISFGLFFNDDVDVEITGNDSLSGVQSIAYYRSETILNEDEVKALTDWTAYAGAISETAKESKKFVYYAKITDNAGNVTILASDGVTFDLTAPVISGIKNGATYYTTQKVTVTDKNVLFVVLNGEEATGDITLDGNIDKVYTIVVNDKAGNQTTVTVTMKPIASLADSIATLMAENVKSSDKESIKQEKASLQAVDITDATEVEKAGLNELIAKCGALLDKINKASDASQSDAIQAAEDITADNVALEDKGTLEDALKDLTDALENNGNNYTEAEKADLQDKIDGIKETLDVIEKVETIKELIDKLPDPENVKLSDEKAIASAKDAYDKLSGYEKSLVDINKLDKAVKAFEKLSGDTNSPDTGDNIPVSFWFVLMLSAAFGVVEMSIYSKKKKIR